ncbi:MAG: hypothetical protein QOI13_2775, partial [Paraburkholderia sp.]|nr:hypothetical protein [Paraburkholderia sp.]
PFVYARITGTVESEVCGYSDSALDVWADRIRCWALGGVPKGLDTVAEPAGSRNDKKTARDVYLYVINGFKTLNPAAGIALLERIGRRGASNVE